MTNLLRKVLLSLVRRLAALVFELALGAMFKPRSVLHKMIPWRLLSSPSRKKDYQKDNREQTVKDVWPEICARFRVNVCARCGCSCLAPGTLCRNWERLHWTRLCRIWFTVSSLANRTKIGSHQQCDKRREEKGRSFCGICVPSISIGYLSLGITIGSFQQQIDGG